MLKKTSAIALLSFLSLEMVPLASLAQTVNRSAPGQGRQNTRVIGNNNNVNQYINIIKIVQPRSGQKSGQNFNPGRTSPTVRQNPQPVDLSI